jgi:hypothetical protein
MDADKSAWALGVKFDMHLRKLPYVALYTTKDDGSGEELVSGGEAPKINLVKKRLKRSLKDMLKDNDGYFLRTVPESVLYECNEHFNKELEEAEAKTRDVEASAIQIMRGSNNRTRIGLVALAAGETWGSVGAKWLSSANKHFCTDSTKYELYLLLLTDMKTLAHIKMTHAEDLKTWRNAYAWPKVVKVGWPEDSINRLASALSNHHTISMIVCLMTTC